MNLLIKLIASSVDSQVLPVPAVYPIPNEEQRQKSALSGNSALPRKAMRLFVRLPQTGITVSAGHLLRSVTTCEPMLSVPLWKPSNDNRASMNTRNASCHKSQILLKVACIIFPISSRVSRYWPSSLTWDLLMSLFQPPHLLTSWQSSTGSLLPAHLVPRFIESSRCLSGDSRLTGWVKSTHMQMSCATPFGAQCRSGGRGMRAGLQMCS
jgi:hypothetical protein